MACLQHPSHYKSFGRKIREQSGGERAMRVHVTAWLAFGMSTHPPLHMIKRLKAAKKKITQKYNFCLHFKRIKPLAITTRERYFFFFTFVLLATVKGGKARPGPEMCSEVAQPQQIKAQQVCREAFFKAAVNL